MDIKAILFDLDGVIIDSPKIWDKSQQIFLAKRNVKYNREELKPLLAGKSLKDGVQIMKDLYSINGNIDELVQERIDIVNYLFEHEIEFHKGFLE